MGRRQSLSMFVAGFVITLLTDAAPLTNNVTATYTASTNKLNLSGDAWNNTVTMISQNGAITLTGSNGTKINGLASWSFNHTGAINLSGNLGDGNDSLSISNSTVYIPLLQLGPGSDTFILTSSNVAINTLDGGPGSDTFVIKGGGSLSIKAFLGFP